MKETFPIFTLAATNFFSFLIACAVKHEQKIERAAVLKPL